MLGPILFTLYILQLGNIIRQHVMDFHCYADDTRLYLSMKSDKLNQLVKSQECLRAMKIWIAHMFLLPNSKTEVLVFEHGHFRRKLFSNLVTLDGISLASTTEVI